MNMVFPTPSDVVGALRTMYTETSESGPRESLFSLLLHSNGQLAGVACLPANAREEHLQACAKESLHRDEVSSVVLAAICGAPLQALNRAAAFYRPYPVMLIEISSLTWGDWTEFISGTTGSTPPGITLGVQRFLGHWEYCRFSDAFARNRYGWGAHKPTRFKSIDKPLERFIRTVGNPRAVGDVASTGGVLVYSECSRDDALCAVDINPVHALEIFQSAARQLSGQARIEALVAAGIAAYFAGQRGIAEHAYLVATQESEEEILRFDHRMLSALGALVSGKVAATTATELVHMHPRATHLGEPVRKTA